VLGQQHAAVARKAGVRVRPLAEVPPLDASVRVHVEHDEILRVERPEATLPIEVQQAQMRQAVKAKLEQAKRLMVAP